MQNNSKTTVKTSILIRGDCFDIDECTKIMGLQPTSFYRKGDFIRAPNIIQKHTGWEFSTGNKSCLDVEISVVDAIGVLPRDEADLKTFIERYSLDAEILVYIGYCQEDSFPALAFSRSTLLELVRYGLDLDIDVMC